MLGSPSNPEVGACSFYYEGVPQPSLLVYQDYHVNPDGSILTSTYWFPDLWTDILPNPGPLVFTDTFTPEPKGALLLATGLLLIALAKPKRLDYRGNDAGDE